eukprot:gene3554-5071_t
MAEHAEAITAGRPPGYAQVEAIRAWIHDHIDYRYGVSNEHTDALDTLEDEAGVCRDFSHVGISLCRSLHIPARMVVGYLHAISDEGQALWRHHIGSTISAIEASPDGETLWAASYGGYLVQLQRSEAGMDPYSISTSLYMETRRWIFWRDEVGPVR